MKPTRRQILQLSLGGAALAAAPLALAGGSPPLNASGLAELDAFFAGEVARGHRAGYVYGVARSEGPVHFKAIGMADIEAGHPMRRDTVFRIASMSKAVTSVAAMTLIESGSLKLSDRVSKYIPDFAATPVFDGMDESGTVRTVPQNDAMTVFHLMTHTSGLDFTTAGNPGIAAQGAALMQSMTESGSLEDQCRAFASVPLAFQPGAGWGYGVSTDVLGRVIEVVTGQRLQDFIEETVTAPLGMASTGFLGVNPVPAGMAGYYQRTPDGFVNFPHPMDSLSWPAGGMGLYSTAPDYMRFLRMLARGGEVSGVRILSSESVARLTRNALPRDLMPIEVGTPTSPGAGHSLAFGVVVDDPPSPPPHRVGDYRWGGSTGTAYFVSPSADLIGVILAQHVTVPDGRPETIIDFVSTQTDFSRMAFKAA